MLRETTRPLLSEHDLVMLDLDGVVYVSGRALPGVPEALARARRDGAHVAFVTNNASRTPGEVAANLRRLGVAADSGDVVTSAQAAARLVVERFGRGAGVWMLGAEGLRHALTEQGLRPVTDPGDAVVVVSGYGPDVLWRDIMRAAVLVRGGLPYVASNADLSLPTAQGQAPGHGVLVRAIADFAGVEATVAGKPSPPLLQETIRRVGGERPLMVGDRLDTDIEGAHAVSVPSLLVLTGVSGLAELASAPAALRPWYIAPDLAGLFEPHPVPEVATGRARLGGWTASVDRGRLVVRGSGSAPDWWRVVASVAWDHLDATGTPVDVDGVPVQVPDPRPDRR